MEQQIKINNAWQRVRLNIPNMMQIFNNNKKNISSCGELWEKIQETTDINAIIDAVEDLAEVDTETAKKWVYERLAVDTWRGGMMQEKARDIIEKNGYSVMIPTEDEDKKGVDLIAHKGKDKINIQIKPRSFFMCRSRVCKCKQSILRNKCKANKILLMTYDNGKFDKSEKNTYLDNIDNLIKRWQK